MAVIMVIELCRFKKDTVHVLKDRVCHYAYMLKGFVLSFQDTAQIAKLKYNWY